MLQGQYSTTLTINVISASELNKVQRVGKQDPFVQVSLDFRQKDSFLKTYTQKNAGDNATWNQSFTVSLNGEPDLFVEVLDEENTVDEVIGFCAIPINQVVHAPGANMNGIFELYDAKGERAGVINLQLAANGFPNSQPPNFNSAPVRGQSYLHEEHCGRIKSVKKKATGVAVGGTLLGGALAIGAGLLGKKLYGEHQEQEEQERLEQEEVERLRQEEERKRKEERENFDQERARFEQEKSEFERKSQMSFHSERQESHHSESHHNEERHNEGRQQHHRRNSNSSDEGRQQHHRRNSDSSDEGRRHHRRHSNSSDEGDARKWNPVGTYAAGDRVKYHGNVYVCLQGHTSNPTWAPNYAHSLWQTE